MTRIEIALAALLPVALGVLAWVLLDKPKDVVEDYKPPIVQPDGSVVIERAPTAPKAKPKHKIPKGATVERETTVTVQPREPLIGQGITVDMTLVREQDGGRRVIASSPDGEIVGGLDIPVETPAIDQPRVWAAGLNLDPIHQTFGVWLDRDMSRLRVGVEANQIAQRGGGHGGEIRIKLGVTF